MGLTAAAWKRFYAEERAALGQSGLSALVRSAPDLSFPAGGALIFPHTRLASSGRLAAAAARSVARSGAERVLALGVLHGARARDAERVRRARAGDAAARAELCGVHGSGAPHDHGHASEEFSLDGFTALLEVAAALESRAPPEVVARYPFLMGESPADAPGYDELERLLADGATLVATADVIHHGIGYGTPSDMALPLTDATRATARGWAEQQLDALGAGDLRAFRALAERDRSDFRDAGPTLVTLLGGRVSISLEAFDLVGYADVLGASEPTWVAAALARVE
jgi:hypothetical protein